MTKEEFVNVVTEGLSTPPAYFPINAGINKKGYESLDEVMMRGHKGLTVEAFKEAVKSGAWILDTRHAPEFTEGFIPGSISIGLEGRFAEWAGSILPFDKSFVLVTEEGKEQETIIRLARVGIDKIEGFLQGGYDEWLHAGEKIDMVIDIEPDELAMDIPHDKRLQVLDVRKQAEFEAGHVRGAINVPLDTLTDVVNVANIDDENNLYIHCAGGYRSVIAASLLKRHGYHNMRNVLGGFAKMKEVKAMPVVYPEGVK
jgi:rhodanese-related sulfurtransferase